MIDAIPSSGPALIKEPDFSKYLKAEWDALSPDKKTLWSKYLKLDLTNGGFAEVDEKNKFVKKVEQATFDEWTSLTNRFGAPPGLPEGMSFGEAPPPASEFDSIKTENDFMQVFSVPLPGENHNAVGSRTNSGIIQVARFYAKPRAGESRVRVLANMNERQGVEFILRDKRRGDKTFKWNGGVWESITPAPVATVAPATPVTPATPAPVTPIAPVTPAATVTPPRPSRAIRVPPVVPATPAAPVTPAAVATETPEARARRLEREDIDHRIHMTNQRLALARAEAAFNQETRVNPPPVPGPDMMTQWQNQGEPILQLEREKAVLKAAGKRGYALMRDEQKLQHVKARYEKGLKALEWLRGVSWWKRIGVSFGLAALGALGSAAIPGVAASYLFAAPYVAWRAATSAALGSFWGVTAGGWLSRRNYSGRAARRGGIFTALGVGIGTFFGGQWIAQYFGLDKSAGKTSSSAPESILRGYGYDPQNMPSEDVKADASRNLFGTPEVIAPKVVETPSVPPEMTEVPKTTPTEPSKPPVATEPPKAIPTEPTKPPVVVNPDPPPSSPPAPVTPVPEEVVPPEQIPADPQPAPKLVGQMEISDEKFWENGMGGFLLHEKVFDELHLSRPAMRQLIQAMDHAATMDGRMAAQLYGIDIVTGADDQSRFLDEIRTKKGLLFPRGFTLNTMEFGKPKFLDLLKDELNAGSNRGSRWSVLQGELKAKGLSTESVLNILKNKFNPSI